MLKELGVGTFALGGLEKLGLSSLTRSTRIVVARGGPDAEARVTRKVPQEWYDHQQALRGVVDRLSDRLESADFVGTVCYVPTDRMDGGVYYCQPEISVTPDATQAQIDQLPESVGEAGIETPDDLVVSDVATRRMNGEFTLNDVDCFDEYTEDGFDGGLFIRNTEWFHGTAGFRVYDDYDEYMYTANHVAKGGGVCGCCVPTGEDMYDTDSNWIGWISDGHKSHDWCTIFSEDYDNLVQYEEGQDWVDGWVTDYGTDYLEGKQGAIRQQGVISGYQEGEVKGDQATFVGPSGCIQMWGKAVKVGIYEHVRQGDSGGPIWWPNSDGNWMITVLTGSEPTGDYTGCGYSGKKGNPAYGYAVWRTFNNTDLRCG